MDEQEVEEKPVAPPTIAKKPEPELDADGNEVEEESPTFESADYGEDGVDPDKLPEWADGALDPDLKIPPDTQVTFIRFKAEWTRRKSKGDRIIVVWPITVKEEKIAYKRSRGDSSEVVDQLTMMAIRCIDGQKVTPERHAMDCGQLWMDLGVACVQMLRNWYARTHSLPMEQKMDFFGNCIVVRSAVAG